MHVHSMKNHYEPTKLFVNSEIRHQNTINMGYHLPLIYPLVNVYITMENHHF